MPAKQIAFIVTFLISTGLFAFTAIRILKIIGISQKQPVRTDKILHRSLHTLKVAIAQVKILRKPVAGTLHALTFWGFIVITAGTIEMMIDGIAGTERIFGFLGPAYSFMTASGEIFAALIILAGVIFLCRRYFTKPKRFTSPEMKPSSRTDATVIIMMILLLMFSLLGMNAAYLEIATKVDGTFPVSQAIIAAGFQFGDSKDLLHEVCWWIHIGLVLLFLNILPYSKHFHVILSVPNVFFRSLEPAGKLPLDMAVAKEVKQMLSDPYGAPPAAESASVPQRFGIRDVEDASWKNIVDSYTCTECGRCSSVCPANITGKKLSPRKLFIDLRQRVSKKGPMLIKNRSHDDGKRIFDWITPEELWACTTCGACMQECPVDIEHVPFIVSMRQYLVMEESAAPAALNSMFQNIENNGAPWAMSASSRFDWANGIEMTVTK